LLSLGVWQVQRLHWKEGVLAAMRAELSAPPGVLPGIPDPAVHNYLPVTVAGRYLPGEVHVLTTRQGRGPGYRIVAPFETSGGRRILIDRGFVPERMKDAPRPPAPARITGNLHWPDDLDETFTPDPDTGRNIWFARQVAPMAAALGTEPVMLVLRQGSGAPPEVEPWPVDTSSIRNDHLNYAITWFSLAVLWAGMTGYLLWRIRRQTV
ncbi:MAG: SURF1 family protein, partial [Alphaproteobacteria bacterium HGW-Alphaproteobacteria-2]